MAGVISILFESSFDFTRRIYVGVQPLCQAYVAPAETSSAIEGGSLEVR